MNRQEILNKITLSTLTEAIVNIEAFEKEYERTQSNILTDIKNTIQTNLELDTRMINDINDCITMSEERAFVIGVIEGIRMIKMTEKI